MDPVTIVIFIAGLFLGTLLNLIVIRLPRERNLGRWPRCTRCGRSLAWWQLLPVVGWLIQAGRGRCCGRQLKALFPVIEIMTAVALTAFYLRYGLSVPFWYVSFVAAVLIVTGAIDWLHRSIYTFVILGAALIVLIATAFAPIHSFRNGLFGALVAGFVFVIFFVLARILFPGKSSPFGLGDVYLGIFIGAALGLRNLMPSLFYGMILAGIFSAVLIVAKRVGRANVPEYISYGTFLCLGALGYLLLWGLSGA
jgi:leader peptidase (prepilin peptidase) / N-methyltransferase